MQVMVNGVIYLDIYQESDFGFELDCQDDIQIFNGKWSEISLEQLDKFFLRIKNLNQLV